MFSLSHLPSMCKVIKAVSRKHAAHAITIQAVLYSAVLFALFLAAGAEGEKFFNLFN